MGFMAAVFRMVAVVVMIKAPEGIWGYLVRRFDWHLFPVQRRVRVSQKSAGR